MGSDSNTIYALDFGLSKRYKNPKTGEHIPYRDHKSLTGTARYASLNAHMGIEQSRRDDLESIGYVLMYFLRGNLPWQGMMGANSKNKYARITEKKSTIASEELCKGYPNEFLQYFQYVKLLKFEDKPDYSYLRKLLKDLFYRLDYNIEVFYDWCKVQNNIKEQPKKKQADSTKVVTGNCSPLVLSPVKEQAAVTLINIPKENKVQSKADIDKKKFKSSAVLNISISNFKELEEVPCEKDKACNVPIITLYKKSKKIGSCLLLEKN